MTDRNRKNLKNTKMNCKGGQVYGTENRQRISSQNPTIDR